jgi:uroporphyrinogen-III synthase
MESTCAHFHLYDLSMKSKVVAILETRVGAHLAAMVERRGGIAMRAPALEEVPDTDPREVSALLEEWRSQPFKAAIFQTGVGTRALFGAADELGLTQNLLELLARTVVVVRGPKPTAELNARQVRIDLRAAAPFTTDTVLSALSQVPIHDSTVLVQRYGATNQELLDVLRARGAAVREIATYRWSVPSNIQPLMDLLDALEQRRVDAAVFTSAVQMHNLYTIADGAQRASGLITALGHTIVASIGPVCSRALRHYGVEPTFEASPPKLGPLLDALEAALSR